MQVPPIDRTRAAELLKESAGAVLTACDVATKAHRRWNLQQHDAAAILFCVAFERTRAESAAEVGGDQSANHFVRAAINFNLAGQRELAEPMLLEATRIDWLAAGLSNDSHMAESAFVQLLQNVHELPTQFTTLFARATERCAELGWEFPRIHPHQEQLLRAALELGQTALAKHLGNLIQRRRPISREVRALLRSMPG
jgi:hypothetical protein